MAAAVVDIGTMIVSSPDIRGGRPRLAGTGMTVMRIAGWHKLGFTAEEIASKVGLSLAQIHAALAYYHANREAVDADLAAESAEYDRVRTEQPQPESSALIITEELFQTLARQWHDETAHLSLTLKKVMHPAYQRIIGFGPQAIPFILRELQRKPGHWFWALQAITGEDPAQPEATVTEAVQAWLQWGMEHQYI